MLYGLGYNFSMYSFKKITIYLGLVLSIFLIVNIVLFFSHSSPVIYLQPSKVLEVGISTGTNILNMNQSDLNDQMTNMSSLGLKWLRFDVDWSLIQPDDRYVYNWMNLDRVVKTANTHNIELLLIIENTPKWARADNCDSIHCPPSSLEDYGIFVSAVVSRYSKMGVKNWEIWNEPNLKQFWYSGPDAKRYVELLKVAYLSIKTIDDSANVISGGTGPSDSKKGDIDPTDFLSDMYANGAKNYFDALGFHPYTYPFKPSYDTKYNSWLLMNDSNKSLRSIMYENGDSYKKIWVTEFGAPTGGPGGVSSDTNYNLSSKPDHVTEELQSEIIADALSLYSKHSWIGPLFIYSYKDLSTSESTNENFFGIIRLDGSKKPAYFKIMNFLRN